MTRDKIADLLAMFEASYPNYKPSNPSAVINVWDMALEEYTDDEVGMAFKSYLKTNTSGFAPAPGQLIDLIHTTKESYPSEREAWSLVSKAIRNSGYNSEEEFEKLPEIIKKAVASPNQLKAWATDGDYNEGVESSNFMRTYRVLVERDKDYQRMPIEVREMIDRITPALEIPASLPEQPKAIPQGIPCPEEFKR